jgi:hypothetical protein
MDRATWVTAGSVVGTVLAAVAMHGKSALEAIGGVPVLFAAFSSGMPLGVYSAILAFGLSLLVWLAAIRGLKIPGANWTPHVSADVIAVCMAVLVTTTLQWVNGTTAGAVLNAFYVGAFMGLLAACIGRAVRAAFRKREAP